jgi:hypothetical protein
VPVSLHVIVLLPTVWAIGLSQQLDQLQGLTSHAIIRLDAATTCGCPACVAPPPAGFTADLLEAAVRRAAATVAVPCPMVDENQGVTLTARWGEQLDVRHITDAGDEQELSAEQVAGYIAKYATKATEARASPWIIV